jgi:hypothetical protein
VDGVRPADRDVEALHPTSALMLGRGAPATIRHRR